MALQVLNLDFCTLSELPPSLGQLTALTTLDVEGNPYLGDTFRPDNLVMPAAFPMELSGLQALKYINLNSCGLTSIPEVSMLPAFKLWLLLLLSDSWPSQICLWHPPCQRTPLGCNLVSTVRACRHKNWIQARLVGTWPTSGWNACKA